VKKNFAFVAQLNPLLSTSTDPPSPLHSSVLHQLQRSSASSEYFICNSVSKSSQQPYSTGARRWFMFAPLIGTDPLMSSVPVEWSSLVPLPGAMKYSWPETCVMSFLSWMITEGSTVCPRTACGYLSAVRYYWICRNVDVSFMSLSAGIRATKAGMERVWNEVHNKTAADKSYLPVSVDMILGFRDSLLQSSKISHLRKTAVIAAAFFGYATLSRVSEYLVNPVESDRHDLVSNDVSFEILIDGKETVVPSYLSHSFPLEVIRGCRIIIRKAKNDQEGRGHKYVFPLRVVDGVKRVFDFTTELWKYVTIAFPQKDKMFFYVPSEDWTLHPNFLNNQLKALATLYNFDPTRVSSHSLRVGGASALAAAGVPEYVIKEMGDWRSLAFLAYLRATFHVFSDAQDILASTNLFSVDKIRASHPSFA